MLTPPKIAMARFARCRRLGQHGWAARGALARQLLATVGTDIVSHVFAIGPVALPDPLAVTYEEARNIGADTPLHCADADVEREMIAAIENKYVQIRFSRKPLGCI